MEDSIEHLGIVNLVKGASRSLAAFHNTKPDGLIDAAPTLLTHIKYSGLEELGLISYFKGLELHVKSYLDVLRMGLNRKRTDSIHMNCIRS